MAVLPPALHELPPVRRVGLWPIRPSAFSFPVPSVASQIAQMGVGRLAAAFNCTIRALTTTRRIRSPGPRCAAECFSQAAASWSRRLPFRGPARNPAAPFWRDDEAPWQIPPAFSAGP